MSIVLHMNNRLPGPVWQFSRNVIWPPPKHSARSALLTTGYSGGRRAGPGLVTVLGLGTFSRHSAGVGTHNPGWPPGRRSFWLTFPFSFVPDSHGAAMVFANRKELIP